MKLSANAVHTACVLIVPLQFALVGAACTPNDALAVGPRRYSRSALTAHGGNEDEEDAISAVIAGRFGATSKGCAGALEEKWHAPLDAEGLDSVEAALGVVLALEETASEDKRRESPEEERDERAAAPLLSAEANAALSEAIAALSVTASTAATASTTATALTVSTATEGANGGAVTSAAGGAAAWYRRHRTAAATAAAKKSNAEVKVEALRVSLANAAKKGDATRISLLEKRLGEATRKLSKLVARRVAEASGLPSEKLVYLSHVRPAPPDLGADAPVSPEEMRWAHVQRQRAATADAAATTAHVELGETLLSAGTIASARAAEETRLADATAIAAATAARKAATEAVAAVRSATLAVPLSAEVDEAVAATMAAGAAAAVAAIAPSPSLSLPPALPPGALSGPPPETPSAPLSGALPAPSPDPPPASPRGPPRTPDPPPDSSELAAWARSFAGEFGVLATKDEAERVRHLHAVSRHATRVMRFRPSGDRQPSAQSPMVCWCYHVIAAHSSHSRSTRSDERPVLDGQSTPDAGCA